MRKSHIFRGAQSLLLVLFVALLAACGGRDAVNKGTSDVAATAAPATYGLTVAADKDSQFDYQGATLTREDLAGHIRYLAEIGKPIHDILLTPGEKQKITDTHVAALASICRELKLTGYVRDSNGNLKVIRIVE